MSQLPILARLVATAVLLLLSLINSSYQQEEKRFYYPVTPSLPNYGYPFSSNTSQELFQVYKYNGAICHNNYLASIESYPLYQPSDSCLQVRPGIYQQSHCTLKSFILKEECQEGCKVCAKTTTKALHQCEGDGEGNWSIVMCGRIPNERPPKMLWRIEHEENKYNVCTRNKVIKVVGRRIVKEKNVWIPRMLRGHEDSITCTDRDYNDGKTIGKLDECKANVEHVCQ